MELNRTTRMYQHSSFEELNRRKGSGMYHYTERLGMGGYFYLSSSGAMPYNRGVAAESTERVHDIYDVLRAVEQGRATRLDPDRGQKFPVLWGFDLRQPPLGLLIVQDESKLEEMAHMYKDHVGFDLGGCLEPKRIESGVKSGYKITAFSVTPRPQIRR